MDHLIVSVTPLSFRIQNYLRLSGLGLIALFGIVVVLAVDFSPAVSKRTAPTAEQALLVRRQVQQIRAQLRSNDGRASIRMTPADLTGVAALISALEKFGQVDVAVADNALSIRSSRQFGFLWMNGEATISSSRKGFPDTRLQIGDLPLGSRLSRWIINRAIDVARGRGIEVPPVDDLVRSLRINPKAVALDIHLPLGGAFANDISNFRTQPIDARLTASIYCRLLSANAEAPTSDMAILVQRAFADPTSAKSVADQNRAAFVALAMYAASPEAGRLAGDATQRVQQCKGTRGEALLAGRADLASHWALSAALAVSLGDDVGRAMGEWKELSDSRPGGSGFSFVDLAADRAGLAFARQASNPETATATARNLRMATTGYLLPIRALALSEGLTERQFVSKFNALDSAQFIAAKARIDAVLAKNRKALP